MDDGDVDAVVELLRRALGPAPGGVDRRELFEWKHLRNPAGRSVALVAEERGRLVGVRTLMRWRLRGPGGVEVAAARAVDTATAPEVRRRGVFSSLTRAALDRCREDGVVLVFNTPNRSSLPGYQKLGWREVARWPMWLRVRNPVRLAGAAARRDLRSGPAVAPAGAGGRTVATAEAALSRPGVERLVASGVPPGGLATARTMEFLRWRYSDGPVPYHALAAGDPLRALVVVRVRARGSLTEAVVCDAIGAEDDLAGLLRVVPRAVGADHAVAHFGPAAPVRPVLRSAGYRRLPRAGMTFVVRPVEGPRIAPGPDPALPASWALSLGDLELF